MTALRASPYLSSSSRMASGEIYTTKRLGALRFLCDLGLLAHQQASQESSCCWNVRKPVLGAARARPDVDRSAAGRQRAKNVFIGLVVAHCHNLDRLARIRHQTGNDHAFVDSSLADLDHLIAGQHFNRLAFEFFLKPRSEE